MAEHLPASITETLGQRLHRMDDDVRRLLDVGAVVGDEFDLDLVSAVAQVPNQAESAARAVRGGVLIEVPGGPARYRFAHALMQRFVYRDMVDYMRRVAKDVFIGRAHRDGKELGNYFVLSRAS